MENDSEFGVGEGFGTNNDNIPDPSCFEDSL